MKDILEDIFANKQKELEQWKQYVPLKQLYGIIEYEGALKKEGPSMKAALQADNANVVAEFLRKTPAKGWLNKNAKIRNIAPAFEKNGAKAISIPTDFTFFVGYDEFLQEAKAVGVSLPLLYKNYIIDEYQLFQAKHAGASAIILTAVFLEKEHLKHLISLSHQLNMEVALELHTEDEIDLLACEPDMVVVNNRLAGSFENDINRSLEFATKLPKNILKLSQGGIDTPEKAKEIFSAEYNSIIIGEEIMQKENPSEALKRFITDINH